MFKVVVDPSSLAGSNTGGPPAGKLHVESDFGCFPDESWWDFPTVVLGWWVAASRSTAGGGFELQFMDGPFRVVCSRQGEELALSFIHRGSGGDIEVGTGTSTTVELHDAIIKAATEVVRVCRAASLPTDGLEAIVDLTS
jgi:hypothetical protein